MVLLSILILSRIIMLSQTNEEKENFNFAKQQLENMLSGNEPLNYEKAVFVTENAYYGNNLNAEKFYDRLSVYANLIEEIAKGRLTKTVKDFKGDYLESSEVKLKKYNDKVLNWAIYKFITDTTFIKSGNDVFYHKPYTYSNNDPLAVINWEKSQVFNLISSDAQTGNCYALTSLFKILSERLKTKASIATAPNHIFIVHSDENDVTYNVEIASKAFPGNGSIESLTYTTDKAIKSHIAMRTLSDKQAIALNLVYLAKSYQHKFHTNTDNFIVECAKSALQYDDLSLNAMLLKAEFTESKLFEEMAKANVFDIGKIKANQQLSTVFYDYEKQLTKLYDLGYLEMPVEMKNILISKYLQDNYPVVLQDHTPTTMQSTGRKHDKDYITLSNGLLDENPQPKEREKYSRAVFDTKTKKIVALTEKDTTYNNYNFDPILFALSVDPMANKFASYSPYTFADDSPIWKIDQDGDSTRYYSERGKLLHISNDGLSNAIVIINSANMNKFMIWKKVGDQYKVGSNSGYNEYLRKMGLTYNIDGIKKFYEKYKNVKYSPKTMENGKKDYNHSDLNIEHGVPLFDKNGVATPGDNVVGPAQGNNPTTTRWENADGKIFAGNVGLLHTHTNEGREINGGTAEYGPTPPNDYHQGDVLSPGRANVIASEYNIYFYGGSLDRTIIINPKKFGEESKPVEKTYTPR